MAIYFRKHPEGPELPDALKTKKFRAYKDAANWADNNNLTPGKYWLRNDKGVNLWTAIRELKYKCERFHGFWVEGQGNI